MADTSRLFYPAWYDGLSDTINELQDMVLKDTVHSFYGDGVFTSKGYGPEKLATIDGAVDISMFWRESTPHHKQILMKYKNKFYAHKKNNGSPLLRENWDRPKITAKVDSKAWCGIIGSIGV